jgi:hypothetical protein
LLLPALVINFHQPLSVTCTILASVVGVIGRGCNKSQQTDSVAHQCLTTK